ncbi:MAG: crossover junction endodeoxyribonuclease RuvC [Sorangium cellulosum]|nr:MAG: crossover junction endodeoxyribonuclease RuvC [Sorangium cellulosum]
MRVIGIDPGTRHLGWGVVRAEGTKIVHEAHGIIHTNTTLSLAQRLLQIDKALGKVLEQFPPEHGAVESIFFSKDPQAAAKLGHARGVVLLLLARAGVPVSEYPPSRVKRAVSGRGRADKKQVAMMVRALLGLKELPGADATDALAVAITHAQFARVEQAMRTACR